MAHRGSGLSFGDKNSAQRLENALQEQCATIILPGGTEIVKDSIKCETVPDKLYERGISLETMIVISCRSCFGCLNRKQWIEDLKMSLKQVKETQ